MSLKIKIAARLKAKAAGVNLSKERIDAIVLRAEKGLTDESDDTLIDANLDAINDLTPFKDIAALDDHERAKAKKIADDKEALRLKAIEEGKTPEPEPDPNESSTDKLLKVLLAKIDKQEQAISAMGTEKVTNTRREQYAKALEGTSDVYKKDALADFDLLNFKDEDHFTGWLTSKSESAKAFVQEDANDGLGVFKPVGGAGGAGSKKEASAAEVEAAVDSIL